MKRLKFFVIMNCIDIGLEFASNIVNIFVPSFHDEVVSRNIKQLVVVVVLLSQVILINTNKHSHS